MKRLIISTLSLVLFAASASAQSYFTPEFTKVYASTATEQNGLVNFEAISFAGEVFSTGLQIKNGWGKHSKNESLSFMGTNPEGLPNEDEYTNQNNDWLISDEIDLSDAKDPVLSFDFLYNYGVDSTNTLGILVCTGGYQSATPQGNDPKATPAGEWETLKKAIYASAANTAEPMSFSLKDFAGKKIRIAFRATNRLQMNINNSRLYEISNLEVKEK